MLTVLLAALVSCAPAAVAPGVEGFPALEPGVRVYDETGTSLTPGQASDLQGRLDALRGTGADAVVLVRALDASSDDTFDQVEALQQAWVARTGADRDTAVAILVNRNPDDPRDARAGVFVGRTYEDGNVPRDEQEAVVEDALIPPLRDGDVHGSLVAAVTRLSDSIRSGPPVSASEQWAAGAARSWLPAAAAVTALAALVAAYGLFRGRRTTDRAPGKPTTRRPGDLPPAVVGALVAGGAPASPTPAVLLDLATRGAVDIEPESDGGTFGSPTVRVRLRDEGLLRDDVERAVWAGLADRADGDLVDGAALAEVVGEPSAVRAAVRARLVAEGWLDEAARVPRAWIAAIAGLAWVLLLAGFLVGAIGEAPWPAWVALGGLAVAALVATVLAVAYPGLSVRGQDAALPWTAYRDGLRAAAEDEHADLDLDAVLPDAVALDLATALKSRMAAAAASGQVVRAFGASGDPARLTTFPWWIAFTTTTTPSGGGATVSGGGAGGGGGAAGST
ncbi:hypothetical protein GCM10017691_27170 [Pseudonocardia petroleophila]|uniref:DUF2207 domain-containing protein n=1 Tax=Pseudonocardia petroleophila TaxID=37331 RepID=A0A7G7MF26_9PSEU|nr:DUF2207 domain-containing protein [Pseudonocardia petroleophila]QNG51387.1 DUF2207 domain-containing protein [Pseudonocardia petroleophila]